MEDIDELIAGTNELLAATSSWLEAVCQFPWNGPEGFLPIIQRSVLKRQFENLETSVFLVREARAYAAVPLLRSACEELIWMKYLNTLTPEQAEDLVSYMINDGIFRDLDAQDREAGRDAMERMGLGAIVDFYRAKRELLDERISQLGRQ